MIATVSRCTIGRLAERTVTLLRLGSEANVAVSPVTIEKVSSLTPESSEEAPVGTVNTASTAVVPVASCSCLRFVAATRLKLT